MTLPAGKRKGYVEIKGSPPDRLGRLALSVGPEEISSADG